MVPAFRMRVKAPERRTTVPALLKPSPQSSKEGLGDPSGHEDTVHVAFGTMMETVTIMD